MSWTEAVYSGLLDGLAALLASDELVDLPPLLGARGAAHANGSDLHGLIEVDRGSRPGGGTGLDPLGAALDLVLDHAAA